MEIKIQITPEELLELKKVSIGKRLKWVIKKMRLTAKAFSEMCGISYRTLAQYLNDQRSPGSNNLKTIADTFGINLHWLITGEGYPFIEKVSTQTKQMETEQNGLTMEEPFVSEKEKIDFDKLLNMRKKTNQAALNEREKRKSNEEDPKKEFEFIVRCVEEVLALPEDERYVKLFEMIGKRHGIGFLFYPEFGEGRRRKLETVRDVIEAYCEINDFIEEMKRKLTGG